jgi:hypothetical protein
MLDSTLSENRCLVELDPQQLMIRLGGSEIKAEIATLTPAAASFKVVKKSDARYCIPPILLSYRILSER